MKLENTASKTVARRGRPRAFDAEKALACGEAADSIRKELAARRELSVTALRRRFERARSEGDLPATADAAVLARYIATVLHGMTIEAASGASAEELRRVAKMVMRGW